MRLSLLSVGLLALLTPLTSAWSKEDREIFRLRDEIATHEGADVTFYEYLGVAHSATQDDINKAYKRRAKELHPDKVKQQLQKEKKGGDDGSGKKPKRPSRAELETAVKRAGDRQARLGVITNVLRGEGRARYDHFLANGFPTWKGTEYYYNRYRPGLGTVLVGCLIAFGGGFHYLALYMSWKRQRDFINRYIKFARHAAWGDSSFGGIPGIDDGAAAPAAPEQPADDQPAAMPVNRKQRRMQERETRREAGNKETKRGRRGGRQQATSGTATPVGAGAPQGAGPQGAKKRVVAENGKVLVVDSVGDVYLEQRDEDGNVGEFLLDPNELLKPTINNTALVQLPLWAYGKTVGRVLGGGASSKSSSASAEDAEDEQQPEITVDLNDGDSSSSGGGPAQRTPSSTGTAEDFEFLDKSTESLKQAAAGKATGSQGQQGGGKAKKRGNKKR